MLRLGNRVHLSKCLDVLLGGGGQRRKQKGSHQSNKFQLSPVYFWEDCMICLTVTHEYTSKDEKPKKHNETHGSQHWLPFYLLPHGDLHTHTTKTMCTRLYKQPVMSRSWLNPCSMLFLRGEWGVRWIRHEGSSPSCHPCPCSGRTETN